MNKKTLLIITIIVLFSCKEKQKKTEKTTNYVVFSGKITNKNSDTLIISNEKLKFRKVIKVSEDGVFKDSFDIKNPSFLTLYDGTEYGLLYLKNGDVISMNVDAKLFDKTIKLSGKGFQESNFLNTRFLLREEILKHDAIYQLSKENFTSKFKEFETTFLKELQKIKDQNGDFVLRQKSELERFKINIEKSFKSKNDIRSKLKAGTPSPDFAQPCESTTGKRYSLKDFRGKYVYIEFWATWCADCEDNHHYNKELVEKIKDKNIQFVGISIDSKMEYSTWKETCKEYELPGIQLLCSNDSAFTKAYILGEIPRFVILDPEGNIINAFAPKASDPNIIEVFNKLGL